MRINCILIFLFLCIYTSSNVVLSQICNSKDPESGGLFLPAFSSGGTKATLPGGIKVDACNKNMTDPAERFENGCIPAENDPQPMAIIYLLLLLWTFVGVGIMADVFMGAIEAITSRGRIIEMKTPDGKVQQIEVKSWNATVANLTLMALGSSAPEILLSVIEIFGNDFYAGDLGPSTIVGSAAFNMLAIMAVVMTALPAANLATGETGTRKIKDTGVHFVTSVFSVFAYIWLAIILLVSSPNVIDLWEAVVTFILFPILVALSFAADKGYFTIRGEERESELELVTGVRPRSATEGAYLGAEQEEDFVAIRAKDVAQILKQHAPKGTVKHLRSDLGAQILHAHFGSQQPVSRAVRRIQAGKRITGGKRLFTPDEELKSLKEEVGKITEVHVSSGEKKLFMLGFKSTLYRTSESKARADLEVIRVCLEDLQAWPVEHVHIDFKTEGGTATPDVDFVMKSGTLCFPQGVISNGITIEVVDDDEEEDEEDFFVQLENLVVLDDNGLDCPLRPKNIVSPTGRRDSIEDLHRVQGLLDRARTQSMELNAPIPVDPEKDQSATLVSTASQERLTTTDSNETNVQDNKDEKTNLDADGNELPEPRTSRTVVSPAAEARALREKKEKKRHKTSKSLEITSNEKNEYKKAIEKDRAVSDAIARQLERLPRKDDSSTILGDSRARITIVDDDDPGEICMASTALQGHEAQYETSEAQGNVSINVVRKRGARGRVSVRYRTIDGTAIGGEDFVSVDDELVFETGEVAKTINIQIIDDDEYEKDEMFSVQLYDPVGCELGGVHTAFVTILSDDKMRTVADRVTALFNLNRARYRLTAQSWKEQFSDALYWPNNDKDGNHAVLMHVISLPWKLMGACIPPTSLWKAWPTFFIALVFVGLITAVIGDLASLFGCSVGLKDSVTAITFVALGTSLPDTFASRTAAINDPIADASVGNVTGSNSVNVFLGLGLPWLIAAIYWNIKGSDAVWLAKVDKSVADEYPGGAFNVPAGDLGFSVIVFCVCAVTCLSTLLFRRLRYGAELGGPGKVTTGTFFVVLWIIYVLVSSLKTYGHF